MRLFIPWTLAWALACSGNLEQASMPTMQEEAKYKKDAKPGYFADEEDMDGEGDDFRNSRGAVGGAPPPPSAPTDSASASSPPKLILGDALDEREEPPSGTEAASEPVRDWFPDAFLWQPLVQTDDSGTASLTMDVPDSLTTWRVLGFAHTQGGAQAGAVHTFEGTLPRYTDPRIPGWLYVGDEMVVPVQAVNNSGEELNTQLQVIADGQVLTGGGTSQLSLNSWGSAVVGFDVTASAMGTGTIDAQIAGDHVVRQIPVLPTGKPIRTTQTGVLTSSRSLKLKGPATADPATQRLTVMFFPGPLAVLQTELERASAGVWSGGYGFALAGHLESLSAHAGVDHDEAATRRLRLLAWQKMAKINASGAQSADTLLALREVGGHEAAEAKRNRLTSGLEAQQRGDGSWSRNTNSSLQQVIVETAQSAYALPEDHRARRRAAGALERFASKIDDPYTAAVVLSTGLLDDGQATTLREQLCGVDCKKLVSRKPGAVNAWGVEPGQSEFLAWATLALVGTTAEELRGDTVARLLQRYDRTWGFASGPSDPICLDAIAAALPGLSDPVDVVLSRGSTEVGRVTLDPKATAAVMTDMPHGNTDWTLTAANTTVGVTWVATLDSRIPWTDEPALKGVEVELDLGKPRAGIEHKVGVAIAGPTGPSIEVTIGLPPGASVDEASIQLIESIDEVRALSDRVYLKTRPLKAEEVLDIDLPITFAFAGSFHAAPTTVSMERFEGEERPPIWVIAP
jgi:hypothetical protein